MDMLQKSSDCVPIQLLVDTAAQDAFTVESEDKFKLMYALYA
jgi:hypothetical protein